jgi:hypothetical protein
VALHNVVIDNRAVSATAALCRGADGRWAVSDAEMPPPVSLRVTAFCPAPGTIVETSLGGWLQFGRSEGARCFFHSRDGGEGSRYTALLGGDSEWLRQGGARLKELFPPMTGRRAWFVVNGVSSSGIPASWYEAYSVGKREQVRVPAGVFDTNVITWEERGREGSNWVARHRFWYAPAVGYVVKFESDHATRQQMPDWVATRVIVPEPLDGSLVIGAPPPVQPSPLTAGR